MPKREGELKSQLFKELPPGYIVMRMLTAGAPDRSITAGGRTTHWEFKHGTPDFISLGNQELFCMRLAFVGHCRYVIWQESSNGLGSRTMIVHPRDVHERRGWDFQPEAWCLGYDHKWLVGQIRKAHQ